MAYNVKNIIVGAAALFVSVKDSTERAKGRARRLADLRLRDRLARAGVWSMLLRAVILRDIGF
jgi:hypothetical protein